MGEILGLLGTLFHTLFYLPVFNGLMLIYGLVHNLAFSIVLLTVLIRVCLIPLTRKQLQAGRKMQELQPQIKQLQAQHRGDPQAFMQAQRALFKEHNYSQMQGCLPLLIQMPLLYALFFSFSTVLNGQKGETVLQHVQRINHDIFAFIPHLQALPHTQFLWVDLAAPDPIKLLPFIAAILTFIQLRMAMPIRPKPKPGQASDATQQASKMTMYLMPAVTFFFGLNFPAGMALYWCVGTLFMAVQQYFLAGWGSLFVGIPGMERFVPEPKVVPALAAPPARGGAAARTKSAPLGAASRQPAAPSAPTAEEGGFRGMFRRLREQMAEAQQQAVEVRAARLAARDGGRNNVVAEGTADGANGMNGANGANALPATPGQTSAARTARQRPTKQAPMLVKPTQKSALPAEALARTNGDKASSNGTNTHTSRGITATQTAGSKATREATTASTATSGNQRSANGATASRPTTGAGRPSTSSQRKGSTGSSKGPSARPRSNNGRPKGGR